VGSIALGGGSNAPQLSVAPSLGGASVLGKF
jgi:hypothetical protein